MTIRHAGVLAVASIGLIVAGEARADEPRSNAARQRFVSLLTSIKPATKTVSPLGNLKAFAAVPVAPASPVNLPRNR